MVRAVVLDVAHFEANCVMGEGPVRSRTQFRLAALQYRAALVLARTSNTDLLSPALLRSRPVPEPT